MIWATDDIGINALLFPPPASSAADGLGDEKGSAGIGACHSDHEHAIQAEVGSTALIRQQGYEVDVLMTAFGKSEEDYIAACELPGSPGDLLWDGAYFGSNVHPYETVFAKAGRNIDPALISHLTEWHLARGSTSWDACAH
jgi:hypothetical protein